MTTDKPPVQLGQVPPGCIDIGFWPTVPGPPPTSLEREYLPEKCALMDQDIAEAEVHVQTALRAAQDPTWRTQHSAEFFVVLAYLNTPEKTVQYRGMSWCRVCGKSNGSQDWFKGPFRYPQGYVHYLVEHDFKPPQIVIDEAFRT